MIAKYLIEKEFKSLFRNKMLLRMLIAWPILMLLLLPYAANQDVKGIRLCVVDNDHSTTSVRLINRAAANERFKLTDVVTSREAALLTIEKDQSDAILEIPRHFEKDMTLNHAAHVGITVNTVNGSKGGLASAYLTQILNSDLNIDGLTHIIYLYNPHLDYKIYMVPVVFAMLLTILCGLLPAIDIVSEKEKGTIEQINVTPVSRLTFVFAKLVPFWTIGISLLIVALFIARLFYGIWPAGSILTLFGYSLVYILLVSGLGIVISNYSDTLQQSLFVMFFFMLIFILMSGFFSPVASMPDWAQWMDTFNPLYYFAIVLRSLFLKGSHFVDMFPQFFALLFFAVAFNLWAVMSYKKNG